MGVDAHIEAAVAAVDQAEKTVQVAAASLAAAVGRAIGAVFSETSDLDAVELWVDRYDDLMLRAAFRGNARYDAEMNYLTEAADVDDAVATEAACLALGALHDAICKVAALRRWVHDAIDACVVETPSRFWTRDFDGAPESFSPGDALKLVAGRDVRYEPAHDTAYALAGWVGPWAVSEEGLDVITSTVPAGDLCLRYTRERRGPVVAARTIEAL